MVNNLIENGEFEDEINQTIELGMQESEVVTELNALKPKYELLIPEILRDVHHSNSIFPFTKPALGWGGQLSVDCS
jgi:hypothetical protein